MKLKIQILIFFLSTTISLSKNLKTKKNLETPQQILEKLKENNKQLRKAKITVNNLLNNKKLPAQEIIKHISQEIGTEYEKEKNKMKLKVKEILNGTYHEPSQNETIEDISNDIVDLIINEQSEKNNENDIFENENSDDEKNVKEEKEEEKNEKKEEKRRRRKGKINKKDKGYLSNANSKNVKTILKNKIGMNDMIKYILNKVNKEIEKEEKKNEEKKMMKKHLI